MNYVEALPGKYGSSMKRYAYSSATDMEGGAPYALKRSWTNITEDLYGGRLDLEYGFDFWNNLEAKVKGGVYYQKTKRDTNQVDVDIYLMSQIQGDTLEEYINNVMDYGGNLGGGPLSSGSATAKVDREQQAAYLMLSLPLLSNVTLTGGARFERLEMSSQGNVRLVGTSGMNEILNTKPNSAPGAKSLGEIIGYTDPTSTAKFSKDYILPSAVLSWNITDALIFRAGGSHTVALPSLREMSPYFSWDSNFDPIMGNPNLKPVDVYAGEARLEYYTESGGMISAGAFYKQLKNPIERFSWYIGTGAKKGEVDTFWNSPETAQIIGYEIEARHHLGFITEELKYISIGVNWSQMDAWIPISDQQRYSYAYSANAAVPGQITRPETQSIKRF